MVSSDTWDSLVRSSGPLSLGELGHGLGALRHGVLRELTRQDQADRRLDVAAADGATLVDAAELGGLEGNLLERVRDEVVDDGHALLGDARLRVHLLEDAEDVRLPGLGALALRLLDRRLGRGLLRDSLRHGCKVYNIVANTHYSCKLLLAFQKRRDQSGKQMVGSWRFAQG